MGTEEHEIGWNLYRELTARDPEMAILGDIDRTWLLAALGAVDITPQELPTMIAHVASKGFDLRYPATGGKYKGMTSDWSHYTKHVRDRREWPDNTTTDDYIASLAEVVMNPTHVFTNLYLAREWQVTFIAPSGIFRGDLGRSLIMVEYRIRNGYWVTGHQPDDDSIEEIEGQSSRSNIRWIL